LVRVAEEGDDRGNQWMLKPYIVYFKYKIVGEKADPPVRQFRIYASNLDEARRLASGYANYPNIEVVNIKPAESPVR
jgi:hypothetical protein